MRKRLSTIWKGKRITNWEKNEGWKRVLGRFMDYFLERKGSTGYMYIYMGKHKKHRSFGNTWIQDHIEEPFESPPKRQSCHEKERPSLGHNWYRHKGAVKENEMIDMDDHQRVSIKRPWSRFFFWEEEYANWGRSRLSATACHHILIRGDFWQERAS